MSDFKPEIRAFCCHYTSQQTCTEGAERLKQDGMPESVSLFRVPCTGKIQVSTLLQAFEDGADAVYVAGCPVDSCHNVKGSMRAAKRVGAGNYVALLMQFKFFLIDGNYDKGYDLFGRFYKRTD